ncbi:hypothetical protein RSOLAG1IB_09556 [Rhizoctonia solani AG-1 IB]|uniref:Uncharacterized protein n=1 Tax=Thanatephorus cucumeris (strain AG1-IB / isolate 7/3/14) TaxID=1108050 RepID=A0A0B7FVR5_THACB|nr:hypothetical protein RSOLAG1IB_09556 [Rhizoctonia solani AG-1 IB]
MTGVRKLRSKSRRIKEAKILQATPYNSPSSRRNDEMNDHQSSRSKLATVRGWAPAQGNTFWQGWLKVVHDSTVPSHPRRPTRLHQVYPWISIRC